MKQLLFLILAFLGVTGEILAVPILQHHVQGVVRSVDQEKHLVVIEPKGKADPGEFTVDDKRTRMRRDNTAVALGDLPVGQHVQLYYKKEGSRCVATEVTWQSANPGQPK